MKTGAKGVLAQHVSTKSVDGADAYEVYLIRLGPAIGPLQCLTQIFLELCRRRVGEGDGGDLMQLELLCRVDSLTISTAALGCKLRWA